MAKTPPSVPGKGDPPAMSTVPGNITVDQMRYYGGLRQASRALQIQGMSARRLNGYAGPSITGYRNINGTLVAGLTTESMRRQIAQSMGPEEAQAFQQWATLYPMNDPRTWVPLLLSKVDPNEPGARAAMAADLINQQDDFTYDGVDTPKTMLPDKAQQAKIASDAAERKVAQAYSLDPATQALSENQTGAGQPVMETPRDNPLGAALGRLQWMSRTGLTIASAPYDLGQAFFRTTLGGNDKVNEFLERNGYGDSSDWRARYYFTQGTEAPQALDGMLGDVTLDDLHVGNFGSGQNMRPLWARAEGPKMSAEEKAHLDYLRDKFLEDPENYNASAGADQPSLGEYLQKTVPSMWDQSTLGVLQDRPELNNVDELGGTGWLPNPKVYELADKESGRAYDVRTVAEQDKDVALGVEILRDAQSAAARAGQLASNPRVTTLDDFMGSRDISDPVERQYMRTGVMPTGPGPVMDGAAVRPGEQPERVNLINPDRADMLDELREQYTTAQTVSEAAVTAYNIIYGSPDDYSAEQQKEAKNYLDQYAAGTKEVQSAILAKAFDDVEKVTAPVGWTPGRGVASALGMDVDSVAAATWSGLIDMALNLTTDPVNLIPLGKGGSLVGKAVEKIPGTLRHALAEPEMAAQWIDNVKFRPAGEAPEVPVKYLVPKGAIDPVVLDEATKVERPLFRDTPLQPPKVTKARTGNSPGKYVLVNSRAWDWLGHGRGQRVVQAVAKETDPIKIWYATGRKIDLSLAKTLARANSEQGVRAALASRIGFEIQNASDLGHLGQRMSPAMLYKMKGVGGITGAPSKNSWVRRQFALAPREEMIDLTDTDTTVNELWRWGNGIGMTSDQMAPHLRNVLYSSDGNGMYESILGGFMEEAMKHLGGKYGMSDGDARRLVTVFKRNDPEADEIGAYANSAVPGSLGYDGGKGSSLLLSEQMAQHIFLPNYRQARRAAGSIGLIRAVANEATNGALRMGRAGTHINPETGLSKADWDQAVLDGMNRWTSRWKYSVLLRPAYIFREIGEMAFAASMAGYKTGLFTHPIALIGAAHTAMLSKTAQTLAGRAMKALAEAGSQGGRMMTDDIARALHMSNVLRVLAPKMDNDQARLTGQKMWAALDEFSETGHVDPLVEALSTVHGNLNLVDEPISRQVGRHLTSVPVTMRDKYADVLVQMLKRLHDDPDVRNMVDPEMSFRDALKKFRTGSRNRRAASHSELITGNQQADRKFMRALEEVARAYTGGDDVLTQAILTGRHGEHAIEDSKALREYIVKRLNEDPEFENAVPKAIGYWDPHYSPQSPTLMDRYDSLATRFFTSVGEFSDVFARAPFLREAYTDQIVKMMPYMTRAARQKAVANLRKAGDHKMALRIMDTPFKAGGRLGIDEVEAIAEGYALREAQRVFYNAYRRQNYAQSMRIVMPFAQATFNTFRRWGEMSMANPQMAYRSMKPLLALQQPGSAVLYDLMGANPLFGGDEQAGSYYTPGRPDLSVNGYFFQDQYGNRVFAYPLVGPLARLIPFLGVPSGAGFLSNMDSLNLAGQSASPGAGPMMTFAASMVTGDTIYHDSIPGEVMRFIFPYGLPEGGVGEKAFDAVSPTVVRGFSQALGDEDERANLTAQTMGTLLASGSYDLTKTSELNRLTADASSVSQGLTWLKAFVSSVTPSTVRPVISIPFGEEGQRRMALVATLAEEYRRYTEKDYDQGTQAFVEDYGNGALLATFAITDANGAPQATNSVWQFRTDHPEEYNRYQQVAGLFFPGGDPVNDMANQESPNAYSPELRGWQAAEHERVSRILGNNEQFPGKNFASEALSQIGWALWNSGTQQIANSDLSATQKSVARFHLKDDLMERYAAAGFDPDAHDRRSLEIRFKALQEALGDEAFQQQQSYPYIKEYMDARDAARQELGDTFGSGKFDTQRAVEYRDHLVDLGVKLMQADGSGAFVNAWNRLFSQELGLDDEEG